MIALLIATASFVAPNLLRKNSDAAKAYASGDYLLAEQLWKVDRLESKSDKGQAGHLIYATEWLANSLTHQGKFSEATHYYNETINLKRLNFGTDSPEVVETQNRLAEMYEVEKRFDKAELVYRKALEIDRNRNSQEHLASYSYTLNNLGVCLKSMGRVHEAKNALTKSLMIRSQLFGLDHPSTRLTQRNLSNNFTFAKPCGAIGNNVQRRKS